MGADRRALCLQVNPKANVRIYSNVLQLQFTGISVSGVDVQVQTSCTPVCQRCLWRLKLGPRATVL